MFKLVKAEMFRSPDLQREAAGRFSSVRLNFFKLGDECFGPVHAPRVQTDVGRSLHGTYLIFSWLSKLEGTTRAQILCPSRQP